MDKLWFSQISNFISVFFCCLSAAWLCRCATLKLPQWSRRPSVWWWSDSFSSRSDRPPSPSKPSPGDCWHAADTARSATPFHTLPSSNQVTWADLSFKTSSDSSAGGGEGCCVAPSEGARVAGEAGVRACAHGGGVHAVLRSPQGQQEGAAEAEGRSSLSGEVQGAQQGHGGETDAAAAQSGPGGGWGVQKPRSTNLFWVRDYQWWANSLSTN